MNYKIKQDEEYQIPVLEQSKGLFNVRNFMIDDENPNPKQVKRRFKNEGLS